MKKNLLLLILTVNSALLMAQKAPEKYPTPEYSNEIYFFNKDNTALSRLEKAFAKAEAKTKMGGMGGAENAYTIEGSKSSARFAGGYLSFVFFSGDPNSSHSADSDSAMRANGMDPSSMGDAMSMLNDPTRTTSLYNMDVEKGNRKIITMSVAGMKLLSKSKKESTKYTLSIKKVRSGYFELVVDKPLARGEYAFLVQDMTSTDGTYKLFAFGVD
jgi:hypothetical protein